MSSPTPRPLRVGLLVDSLVQPAWVRHIVAEIQASDVAVVALVIRNAAQAPAAAPRTRLGRWVRNRDLLLYSLYMRLDARRFPASPDAFAPADLAPMLEHVPQIAVVPRMTAFSDYFEDADVEAILAQDLDVALRFGFRILRGRALAIARHGVWSYHHGDTADRRGGPAGFWEVMDAAPVTGSVLQVLSEELDGGRVLYRSYANTHPLSVNQNRHTYYWKASTFVMRKLRDLHRDADTALADPAPRAGTLEPYSERLYVRPTNAQMARLLGRLAARYVARVARARTEYHQWTIAYRLASDAGRARGDVPDLVLHRFRFLSPPEGHFWADPFVAWDNGRHVIFFEDFSYASRRGHIAAITIGRDGTTSAPVPVLVRDHHLSYPFVFTWGGEHYMIPESNASGTVDLYRARDFPFEWKHDRTILEGQRLVDVTLQEIDGRWWMFATAPPVPDVHYASWCWDELHVFHADSPLGPWTPHPRNPVVSDVRRARPAGRLFQHDGVWYRPAQDCAGGYGVRLALQRITRLDPEHYEEVPHATLAPRWRPGLTGLHTINAARGLTVIDVRRRRRQNPITMPYRGPAHADAMRQLGTKSSEVGATLPSRGPGAA